MEPMANDSTSGFFTDAEEKLELKNNVTLDVDGTRMGFGSKKLEVIKMADEEKEK